MVLQMMMMMISSRLHEMDLPQNNVSKILVVLSRTTADLLRCNAIALLSNPCVHRMGCKAHSFLLLEYCTRSMKIKAHFGLFRDDHRSVPLFLVGGRTIS